MNFKLVVYDGLNWVPRLIESILYIVLFLHKHMYTQFFLQALLKRTVQ